MTGTQQALKECSLKAGMLNARRARAKGKKKRRVGKGKHERKGEGRKNKEIN